MKDDLKLQRIQELSLKIVNKTISEQELIEFNNWYSSYDDHIVDDLSEQELDRLGRKLYQSIQTKKTTTNRYIKLIKVISSCAAVFVLLCLGYWTYRSLSAKEEHILPGQNQAFVKDAEGNLQRFDELKIGDQQQLGSLSYMKQKDGSIAFFEDKNTKKNNEISTVITPKGGEYKIYLPDGTLVWMNADTKLEFNTAFTQHARYVRVKGEAYFEVKHWLDKPFIVETPSEKISVLGTKFNVSAYDTDISATSLTEGSVQIASANTEGKHILLKPGQQALNTNGKTIVRNFDASEVLAWKNGEFMFDQVRLEDVAAALSRWYNVEFKFETAELKEIPVWGTLSKYEKLEDNLNDLQRTQIARFEIKGRRVMVSK